MGFIQGIHGNRLTIDYQKVAIRILLCANSPDVLEIKEPFALNFSVIRETWQVFH